MSKLVGKLVGTSQAQKRLWLLTLMQKNEVSQSLNFVTFSRVTTKRAERLNYAFLRSFAG